MQATRTLGASGSLNSASAAAKLPNFASASRNQILDVTIIFMHICFFDIDGTLILTGGAGQAAFELTFAEEFGVDRWTGDVAFSGRSDRAIVGDIFREYGIEASDSNWRRFSEAYLQRLPKTLAEREGRVLPGVSELLSTLGGRSDIAVGLLTGNTQAGANGKLSHFGIETHFDFGGFGDVHIDRNDIAAEAL